GRRASGRMGARPGGGEVVRVRRPGRMVGREWRGEPTVVRLPGGLTVGGREVLIVAGPCAVESEAQILATARAVKGAGASALRAGAFKPRTSPYAFQGLGARGLELLAAARAETGLPIATESMDEEGLAQVAAGA